jgi:hypothetical protein
LLAASFALCKTPTRRNTKSLLKRLLFFSTKKKNFLLQKSNPFLFCVKMEIEIFFDAKHKKLNSSAQKLVSCYKKVNPFLCFVKQMEIQVLWIQKFFVFWLMTNFDLMEK